MRFAVRFRASFRGAAVVGRDEVELLGAPITPESSEDFMRKRKNVLKPLLENVVKMNPHQAVYL